MRIQVIKRLMMVLVMSLTVAAVSAQQDHQTLKRTIKKWENCKNVAITNTQGDVALRDRNEYAADRVPASLLSVLKNLRGKKELIDDVEITEAGRWCVLYGQNETSYSDDIPEDLKESIADFKNRGYAIRSITFNDRNEWMIVSDKYFAASSIDLSRWLKEGLDKWGNLWAVDFSDAAAIAIYEKGVRYRGNVPESLRSTLLKTSTEIYRLKVAGSNWFFADSVGKCSYSL